jgi:hypothetical protein
MQVIVIVSLVAILLFAIGFVLGWLIWRSYFLAVAPALVIALVLWIWGGWTGETSEDLDRGLTILLVGFYLLLGVVCWAVGAALGRVLMFRRSHPGSTRVRTVR